MERFSGQSWGPTILYYIFVTFQTLKLSWWLWLENLVLLPRFVWLA